jgi:HD superfamily phosphohydrolase
MDTLEFQRLRHIKQLGLAYYVYPSAVHTRFEHSLGVMHLAGKVVDILRQYVQITDREKEIVQLAGLLHDVGHVALSHLTDYFLEEKGIGNCHEDRSVWIMRKINKRLGLLSRTEEDMIDKMIHGKYADEKKPYLFEIVSNSTCGVDVDRLDYLQRDLYHTGMPSFQPDYLIRCMTVQNGRLSLKRKALSEMEMLYDARKRLLMLVCRHKTVMSVETLIRQALTKLDIVAYWDDESWLTLTDATLQARLDAECPELMLKIHQRIFRSVSEQERFNHVKHVTREDIDACLNKIIWTN